MEKLLGLNPFRPLGSSLLEQMFSRPTIFLCIFYSSSKGHFLRIVYYIYLPLTYNQVAPLMQTPSFLPSGSGKGSCYPITPALLSAISGAGIWEPWKTEQGGSQGLVTLNMRHTGNVLLKKLSSLSQGWSPTQVCHNQKLISFPVKHEPGAPAPWSLCLGDTR